MEAIELTVKVGDKERKIEISLPSGAGGDSLHLYVDRYYYGIFLKYQGNWEFRPQRKDHGFSDENIWLMIDKIETNDSEL